MKKVLILLFTFSLFLCSCSNNVSNDNFEDSSSVINELNDLDIQENNMNNIENENTTANIDPVETESELLQDIPKEYEEALEKAILYGEKLHQSKLAIYEKLTSDLLNFSEEAANYAIDNYNGDYFLNALEYANQYGEMTNLSKIGLYNHLISDTIKFTEEEAQYAIENTDVDFKEKALNLAKLYQDLNNMSIDEIREFLAKSEFTEEEIDYAINNIE